MMNVFYPNFLRDNHTALLGISILFILNIVLTILVITLSIKTNLLESRMITVGIYLFIGLLLLVLNIGIPKNFTNLCFYPIDYIPFFIRFCFWGSYFFNCIIKILNNIYIKFKRN